MLPAPGGRPYRPPDKADLFPGPLEPAHQVDVFHQGDRPKPADLKICAPPQEKGLISVRDPRQPGPEGGSFFDESIRRTGSVDAKIEGAAVDSRILQDRPETKQPIWWKTGVCMKKEQYAAGAGQDSRVHLRSPAPGATDSPDGPVGNRPERRFFRVTVDHDDLGVFDAGHMTEPVQGILDPIGFFKCRDDDRNPIPWPHNGPAAFDSQKKFLDRLSGFLR